MIPSSSAATPGKGLLEAFNPMIFKKIPLCIRWAWGVWAVWLMVAVAIENDPVCHYIYLAVSDAGLIQVNLLA